MRCPVDQAELQVTDRQGVEIDYCPRCRGVWLDRGELDKLIERSTGFAPAAQASQYRPSGDDRDQHRRRDDDYRYRDRDDDDDDDDRRRHGRRRGWLGDIFDFG
jgi:Zn-finger nucleic acid-binding protein